MKKILISGALIALVAPQIALASWWNPLSWGMWNIFRPTPLVQQVQIATTLTPAVITTTTEKVDTKVVSTKKPVVDSKQKVSQPNIKQPSVAVPSQSIPTPAPSCQADTWSCGDWSECPTSGNQTRSCTKTFDCPSVNIPPPTSTQSCTPPTPIPIPALSYEDQHCPKVIKIEDSLGNTSSTNHLNGTFKKGDVGIITIKVTASDPQTLPLHYQYSSTGLIDGNSTIKDWSGENNYSINVTNAFPGIGRVVFFSIDNQDNFSCVGDYTDIHGSFNYTVLP